MNLHFSFELSYSEVVMVFEKKKILEAKIIKRSVPKLYKNMAPKYDKWAKLA